jgi:MarR family transcriptional regulator, organic hydroperoxide resistance regulator
MKMKELTSQLLDFYPRIYFACHTRHVVDIDTNVKITANQAGILDHLEIDEPITLFDLSVHMGVTPSTMSITIERLVKLGYVERAKDKRDGRKVNLTLTKTGAKIKRSKSVLDPKLIEALLNRLSEEERGKAIEGLALLAYASDLEMKAKSLNKSWNKRNS